MKIWNAETGELLQTTTNEHDYYYNSVAFSPNGKRLVATLGEGEKDVLVIDVETGDVIQTFEGHHTFVNSATFSHNGRLVVSASDDGSVRIWDVETGIEMQSLEGLDIRVNYAAFSPDDRHVVLAFHGGTVKLWDFPPLQELIDQTRERFKDRPLTPEERRMYYLE